MITKSYMLTRSYFRDTEEILYVRKLRFLIRSAPGRPLRAVTANIATRVGNLCCGSSGRYLTPRIQQAQYHLYKHRVAKPSCLDARSTFDAFDDHRSRTAAVISPLAANRPRNAAIVSSVRIPAKGRANSQISLFGTLLFGRCSAKEAERLTPNSRCYLR
jgi:hypothetical protein